MIDIANEILRWYFYLALWNMFSYIIGVSDINGSGLQIL